MEQNILIISSPWSVGKMLNEKEGKRRKRNSTKNETKRRMKSRLMNDKKETNQKFGFYAGFS